MLFYRLEIGVGLCRVETLVTPHESNQILRIGEVDDVVRITRNHLHDPDLFATYLIIDHRVIVAVFVFAHLAQLDQSVSVHHHELFVLRVMPVLALGDTRFG